MIINDREVKSFTKFDVLNIPLENSYPFAVARLNPSKNKIELTLKSTSNLGEKLGVICQKQIICYETSKSAELYNYDSLFFDDYPDMTNQKIVEFKELIERIDLSKSYDAIFSNLWFGAMTCSGVEGISAVSKSTLEEDANYNMLDRSFLKYCSWKGVPIECAAIFSTFPTDLGICCAFNMKAAEDIYLSKNYTKHVKDLQEYYRNYSASDPSLPNWYKHSNEPKSSAGRNKGLFVMLDAHSNLLANSSMDLDYTSFTGLISYRGSFPYMAQEGFEIRPGHHNIISLGALRVEADDSMRSLNPESRKCRFYDESSNLLIYKTYTYANCMFECTLLQAHQKYDCIPWYFPFTNENFNICNPWKNKEFLDEMNSITADKCPNCLPECSSTLYDSSITTFPFRKCDLANKDMSLLCNFSMHWARPLPKKYLSQIQNISNPTNPENIWMDSKQSNRSYPSWRNYVFINNPKTYDAFETDIATLEVFFSKSSVVQMGLHSKMSWIDYFANVGGLLGLVLGMGFVSFIEVFWFFLRVLARSLNLTQWII